MSHVAWSVCLGLGTTVSCAKTAEPIEIPFGDRTLFGGNLVCPGPPREGALSRGEMSRPVVKISE